MTDTPSGSAHVPVLLEQVVEALAPVDKGVYIDGTYGGGGYSRAVLAVADCKIIAIDRDPDAQARAWEHAGKDARLRPAPGRFSELHLAARANGHEHVDGVMLDLGVSSFQIDQAERGFSFMRDGPLDMRMEKSGPSAADAVNLLEEKQLSAIFHFLGEEPASRRIAKAIVARRADTPFSTTLDLAGLIESTVGGRQGKRTHPATRAFQALRLYVNDELGELVAGLSAAEDVIRPGGRIVVVSFHSLEDRIVKHFLRERSGNAGGGSRHAPEAQRGAAPSFELIARRSIEPTDEETAINPRARSSRLRYAIRTDAPAWGEADGYTSRLPRLSDLEGMMS